MPAHSSCGIPAILLVVAMAGCAQSGPTPGAEEPIRFDVSDVTPDQASRFNTPTAQALAKVDRRWGTPFGGQITVRVSNRYRISRALVPAWREKRGGMEMPARRVRDGMAAMVHDLTHVLAPNSNRFLAEGLATYAEEHLRGVPAFLNFGEDLLWAAKVFLTDWTMGDMVALERIATPGRLRIDGRLDEHRTYVLTGSLLRWLIETQGADRLRRLYALTPLKVLERMPGTPERWATIYPTGLGGAVWQILLERLPTVAAG